MRTEERKDKPIVIGDGEEEVFYCSYCSRRLLTLPKGVYECGTCAIKFTPDNQLRMNRGRMITTLDGDIPVAAEPQEPAVSNTPGPRDISIRHEKELRGGFKALSQKGIKFTSYSTSEKT